MTKDAYDDLMCETCNTYLQRVISNEELEEKYPVSKIPVSIQDKENMKIWMDLKRLWHCEKCGEVTEISINKLKSLAVKKKMGIISEDKLLNKLKCAGCGSYWESKFTNEELQKRYPYDPNVRSLKNRRNKNKFINAKRLMVCPKCGDTTKISKKLLMKVSRERHKK